MDRQCSGTVGLLPILPICYDAAPSVPVFPVDIIGKQDVAGNDRGISMEAACGFTFRPTGLTCVAALPTGRRAASFRLQLVVEQIGFAGLL